MKRILLATAASALLAARRAGAGRRQRRHHPRLHRPARVDHAGHGGQRRARLQGGLRFRQAAGRPHAEPGPRRLRPASTPPPRPPPPTNLVTGENVAAIMGADCSGVTTAIANNVAIPNGVVMVSPSATSPALTDDRGRRLLLPHRALRRPPGRDPRRHRQGEGHRQRRDHLHQQRLRQGLRRRFAAAFQALGGTVAINAAHEDGKADYSAEVAALQASGAPALGRARLRRPGRRRHRPGLARHRRLRAVLLRRRHVRPEPDRLDRRRDQRQGRSARCPASRARPPTSSPRSPQAAGMDPTGTYVPESYDAAALIALAIAAAGGRRPHRHPRQAAGRRQRARRADLRGRARQGPRARRRRHRHRLRRRAPASS